jgi:ABC-type nitrate/sulfonate/bicarbonate transport system substrate-binding protein
MSGRVAGSSGTARWEDNAMTFNNLNRREMMGVSIGAALTLLPGGARGQTPPKKLPVNIVNAGGNIALAFEETIKRLGYLEGLGLEATTTNVADSSKIISSILSGDSDICMMAGIAQALPAIEKGGKLKIVGGAGSLASASLFSAKPEVKTVKDLAGKTVGTGPIGAALHQISVALLQKNGVDVSTVKFVNVGATGDIFKAVVAGTVDAGTVNVDAYDQMEKYKIHPIADFFTDLAEYPFQGSFTSDNAIRNKRETLVRTMAAYAKLYRFVQSPTSKDAYVAAYAAGTGGNASAGEAHWRFMQKYKPYPENLVIPDKNIEILQQVNIQTGIQKASMPAANVADMSLAREAVKLI